MVGCIFSLGSLRRPSQTIRMIESLFEQVRNTRLRRDETLAKQYWPLFPVRYWPVLPAPVGADGEQQLFLRGAVLVRVDGKRDVPQPGASPTEDSLPAELITALNEAPTRPAHDLSRLLLADGFLAPAMLVGALFLAAAGVVIEAVLFRGLLDLGADLYLTEQRIAAIAVLAVFLGGVLMLNLPIISESLRLGRQT
jgi:ATP-binding cassette subfamily B protein